MTTNSLTNRLSQSYAKFGRSRTYNSPRHLNEYMLKDISFTADDIGMSRKR